MAQDERLRKHLRTLTDKHNASIKRGNERYEEMKGAVRHLNGRLSSLERSPWRKFADLFRRTDDG